MDTIDRPSQTILNRIVGRKTWRPVVKRRAYVKSRGLWHPELLRNLRGGYFSGKLAQVIPTEGKIKHQLEKIGLLNERGNDFFL